MLIGKTPNKFRKFKRNPPKNQVGFWKGFQTFDHVFIIKIVIDKYFNENKKLLTFVSWTLVKLMTIYGGKRYYKLST